MWEIMTSRRPRPSYFKNFGLLAARALCTSKNFGLFGTSRKVRNFLKYKWVWAAKSPKFFEVQNSSGVQAKTSRNCSEKTYTRFQTRVNQVQTKIKHKFRKGLSKDQENITQGSNTHVCKTT